MLVQLPPTIVTESDRCSVRALDKLKTNACPFPVVIGAAHFQLEKVIRLALIYHGPPIIFGPKSQRPFGTHLFLASGCFAPPLFQTIRGGHYGKNIRFGCIDHELMNNVRHDSHPSQPNEALDKSELKQQATVRQRV